MKKKATVYFTARNPDKADAVVREIVGTEQHDESNVNLHVVHLDLSDLESVKKGADTFKAQTNRLDVLINNGTSFSDLVDCSLYRDLLEPIWP